MSSFNKRLFEALQLTPLTTEDSHLKPVKHGLKQSNQRFRTPPSNIPPEVHSNLKRERVKLSDNIVVDYDVITEEDLPLEAPPKVPEAPEAQAAPTQPAPQALPSTTGTSVEQIKGQLVGIAKQFMPLSTKYPSGSVEQDKFIELGKRISEIASVLERDFGDGKAQAPTAPSPEAPPQGESLEPEGQEGQEGQGPEQPEDEFDI